MAAVGLRIEGFELTAAANFRTEPDSVEGNGADQEPGADGRDGRHRGALVLGWHRKRGRVDRRTGRAGGPVRQYRAEVTPESRGGDRGHCRGGEDDGPRGVAGAARAAVVGRRSDDTDVAQGVAHRHRGHRRRDPGDRHVGGGGRWGTGDLFGHLVTEGGAVTVGHDMEVVATVLGRYALAGVGQRVGRAAVDLAERGRAGPAVHDITDDVRLRVGRPGDLDGLWV